MSKGFVLWFTGLSGAGKSTLCAMVAAELRQRGVHVETLDGDEVRKNLSKGLGFSKEDRDENVRRLGFVARLAARSGACAITAAISPYRAVREEIRAQTPRFCEVYCECPVSVLKDRDPKGLYEKALRGEIKNFTGIDDPYEAPEHPDVLLHTDSEPPKVSARRIVERLEELGFVARSGSNVEASDPSGMPLPHGGELSLRGVTGTAAAELREKARALPRVVVDAGVELTLAALASGGLSPLRGFMGEKDFLRVKAAMRLESGLFWPEPVLLAVGAAEGLEGKREVALCSASGEALALLQVQELWRHELAGPGFFLAGDVTVFGSGVAPQAATAKAIREQLVADGLRHVVAQPVNGYATKADEHLLRAALEFADAVAVVPRASSDASESLSQQVVLRDYFPKDRALLLPSPGLPSASELGFWLLSAIVAQNCGCARLLAPEESAGMASLYDLFARGPAKELGIRLLPHAMPAWSQRLQAVVSTRTAPDAVARATPPSEPDGYREEVLALMSRARAAVSE